MTPCPTKRKCGCDGSGLCIVREDGGYSTQCLCTVPTWVHERCTLCDGSGVIGAPA